ncbi:hypothetical protein [Bradyrhizobium embrapense]|uniref:hypothetical protein n=1 Tax=Bradyrhizobium embrapense TaxID=630921 RepID=UPI0012F50CD0|nr:hypothetical protein [Bradyrhizobium embrapense]
MTARSPQTRCHRPASTGRSSIPEAVVVPAKGRGVLDAPLKAGHDSELTGVGPVSSTPASATSRSSIIEKLFDDYTSSNALDDDSLGGYLNRLGQIMREKSSLTYIEAFIAAGFVAYLGWDQSWGLPPGLVALFLGVIVYFAYLALMRRLVRFHQNSYEVVATILAAAWGVLAYLVTSALQAGFANQIPASLLMHLWPLIATVAAFIGALASKVRFMDDVRDYVASRRARWDNQQWLEEDAGF